VTKRSVFSWVLWVKGFEGGEDALDGADVGEKLYSERVVVWRNQKKPSHSLYHFKPAQLHQSKHRLFFRA